jgi:hypothetical protein
MTAHLVGRNRFDAAPKEQPPRKLSGKRTSETYRTLERSLFYAKGSPKG